MGGSKLKASDARKIAEKLKAEIKAKKQHDVAYIEFAGQKIGHFGIRRGSNVGHGHVPGQIYVSETQAVALAVCTMSSEQYIALMVTKGVSVR
jgi:hypothetical protein